MKLADVLSAAAGITQVDEPLWILIRDEVIPDEDTRRAMVKQAFDWELVCGKAGRHDDLREARALRQYLRTAPVGVSLDEVSEMELVAA